jgi:PTH1 family peptidyl-tRNA hydrolase
LIVGLGNPGAEHARTRHNVGFMVAEALVERWGLGRAKSRFRGRIVEGRVGAPPGQRVAVLCPQTYMNDAGRSVGPARGAFKLPLERVVVVYDEIDLPFGEVRTRTGGGLAGHNGLKSIKSALGGADFTRVRVGVGRPDSTDPEIVSAYVLGRFREDPGQVSELVEHACDAVEHIVLGGTQAGGRAEPPDAQDRGAGRGEREAMGGRSRRGEAGS